MALDRFTLVQFINDYSTVPIGGLYLAAGLRKHSIPFALKLFAVPGGAVNLRSLYAFFEDSSGILGVGCMSDILPQVLLVLSEIKKRHPRKTVILGGPGPTVVAEEILKAFAFIDFVIKGCGVSPLPRLIKAIENGGGGLGKIGGLVYRAADKVISNSQQPPSIHVMPDYGGVGKRDYFEFFLRTSAGCPFRCTFCNFRPLIGGSVENRSMREIADEISRIEEVKRGEAFHINVIDEAFMIDRRRVKDFCGLIDSRRNPITWNCYGRIDRVDEGILSRMSKSGCENIYFGVESGSNRVLKKTRKGFNIEQAIKALLLARKYIKTVRASFIFRFPFETAADFKETLCVMKFLKSRRVDVQLWPLTPCKGTGIYAQYKDALRFSPGALTWYDRPLAYQKECLEMISSHPEIFYDRYYYEFKGLSEIMRLRSRERGLVREGRDYFPR